MNRNFFIRCDKFVIWNYYILIRINSHLKVRFVNFLWHIRSIIPQNNYGHEFSPSRYFYPRTILIVSLLWQIDMSVALESFWYLKNIWLIFNFMCNIIHVIRNSSYCTGIYPRRIWQSIWFICAHINSNTANQKKNLHVKEFLL